MAVRRNKTPVWRVLEGAPSLPMRYVTEVEKAALVKLIAGQQDTKCPATPSRRGLNYLKNFHIYLTVERFAGSQPKESQTIGQFADELTSKPALICITRWR
jgi:hypothetical protein